MDLLGDMNKIRLILVLEREGTLKKTDLYSRIRANNANARKLEELEREGIVEMTTDVFAKNMTNISLTPEGHAVAKKLLDIENILSGEEPLEGDSMDYDAPSQERDSVS